MDTPSHTVGVDTTPGSATLNPTPPPRRRLPLIVGVAVGAVVLVAATAAITVSLNDSTPATKPVAAAASPTRPATTETMAVSGNLTIMAAVGVMNLDDTHCTGMRGYDDIREGTQVVVSDEAGKVIATGSLGIGFMIGSGMTRTCKFHFSITSVPKGHPFYSLQVSHRGSAVYTEAQLVTGPELSLG